MSTNNLENGMLLFREPEDQPEKSCDCAWCGEAIYVGDEYYELAGESVCADCINEKKRRAEAI